MEGAVAAVARIEIVERLIVGSTGHYASRGIAVPSRDTNDGSMAGTARRGRNDGAKLEGCAG